MHYGRLMRYGDPLGEPNFYGPIKDRQGYVRVWAPDHPKAHNKRVHEHRVVMEQMLGRDLLPGENVHHKNGVRDDNRPENLELWVTFQPAGQRVEDLLAWAHELIERYET